MNNELPGDGLPGGQATSVCSRHQALGREMSQIIVEAFGAPGARHLESARRALAKRPVEQLEQSVERWDGWMWGKLQQKPLEVGIPSMQVNQEQVQYLVRTSLSMVH